MKLVEVVADAAHADTIAAIAEQHEARDFRLLPPAEDGRALMRLLVADDRLQATLDGLQNQLGMQPEVRVHVVDVELVLPRPDDTERGRTDAAIAARESLYASAQRDARLDGNYLLLVALSTVVAAIGLIEDNVAVVIGAMVIAPLLGPNLAFGLGTALGDVALMRRALVTLAVGVALAVALGAVIGLLWPAAEPSEEVAARTSAGLDSAALALASGAAAALSLSTGLSSVLVGVMVAVALLPPAATLGIVAGYGRPELAAGAGLLLAINVVCVNLACKLVFLYKGIAPRTWWEQQAARRAMRIYIGVWVVTLAVLMLAIHARQALDG